MKQPTPGPKFQAGVAQHRRQDPHHACLETKLTRERLNYGRIPTTYLHVAFLAALYVLIRQTGGEPEDAAVLMTLIGGGLMKIRL